MKNLGQRTGNLDIVVKEDLDTKQATLISGTNIKTINSTSILGSGNIDTKELFVCTYGTTTYAEITTALSAGKLPVCFYDNKQYVYVGLSSTNRYTFCSQLFDTQRYVSVNSSDSWGAGTNNFEVTSNKVTSISSSSTNAQYPSAKCTYDAIEDVREVATGKTATFVCSDVTNTVLNSQNASISISSALTDINGQAIALSDFNIGDNIYITETDVPDRWVSAITKSGDTVTGVTLNKLETAKVPVADVQINGTSITSNNVADIITNTAYDSSTNKIATMSDLPTNYVTTNTTQTISATKTFSANQVLNNNKFLQGKNVINVSMNLIGIDGFNKVLVGNTSLETTINTKTAVLPSGNNSKNLGSSAYKWAKAYVTTINNGGNISVPTTSGTMALTSDIPTVNNSTITITQGGTTKGTFTLNQSSNQTIALDAGGEGGTSTDVQINGTSITSSNVANIVTNSAYNASTNKIATMSDLPDITDKANTNLSNVTYPILTNGSETTGNGDRVIKRYVSGTSWYEIYASGWKRCGFRVSYTGWTEPLFPNGFKFSNTNYSVYATPIGIAYDGNCVAVKCRYLRTNTLQSCMVYTSSNVTGFAGEAYNIICEGY